MRTFAQQDARKSSADAALRASGTPLPVKTQRSMETRFQHDFSRVRVHYDASAAEALHANAFTAGQDIVFGSAIDLASPRGERLLAHELTHVVQQQRGGQQPLSLPWSASEREASRIAGMPADSRADVRESCGTGIAREPRSFTSTVDFGQLDDAALVHEIEELRLWLAAPGNQASSANRDLASTAIGQAGAELQRRHPPPRRAPAAAGPAAIPTPLAAGMMVTPGLPGALRPPLPPSIVAPEALAEATAVAEEAVASGSAVAEGTALAETGAAAAETGTVVEGGLAISGGALALATLAGLVVLLWPSSSIVSGDEERRMLEQARRRAANADPHAVPQTQTQSTPRQQQDCMQQNHAGPCDGTTPEIAAGTLAGVPVTCTPFSTFGAGQMYDCGGAPGVVYHCTAPGLGYVVSAVGCLCCNPDGSTSHSWVAHQSSEESGTGRRPQDRTRQQQRERQRRDRDRERRRDEGDDE